jgi:beta-lactamase regulating signal transducer with metallopeptidase domain
VPLYVTRGIYYAGVHVFFASSVCLLAWALTLIPRGSATTKYWIWVATSLNFAVPLGAIVDKSFAAHLSWAAPLGLIGEIASRMVSNSRIATGLAAVWLVGALAMFIRLVSRIRFEQRNASISHPVEVNGNVQIHGIPITFDATQLPGVGGVLYPRISFPRRILDLLSVQEFDAVLLHELTHARRRDNLLRLLHEVALCGLWFHPLVWLAGERLALYRELSCDDSAILVGRRADLVSALSKLASLDNELLLRASISSQLTRRLSRLDGQIPASGRLGNVLLTVAFSTGIGVGVFETVAHTACCFLRK